MVFLLSNLLIGDGGARIKDSGTSLSSVGGAYDFGNISKNLADTNTTTVYNHNLGKVPKFIDFTYRSRNINGFATATGYCIISNYNNYSIDGSSTDTTYSIKMEDVQFGKITNATSTTFTIEWYRNSSGATGTRSIIYKLYA